MYGSFSNDVNITGCEGTSDGANWSPATLNVYQSSGVYIANCFFSGLSCGDGQALTLNLRATDESSNTGAATALSRVCDAAAPVTTDNAPSGNQTQDVTVALSPSDTGSGVAATFYCKDASNACDPLLGSVGTSVLVGCPAGSLCQTYVRYLSKDQLNNFEAAKSALVVIDKRPPEDTQPPITASDAPAAWQAGDVLATLSASDAGGSGVANTKYCTDGANACAPGTIGNSVSIGAAPGAVALTYLRYHSIDNAGNLEAVKSDLVRIDKQAPTTTDNAPAGLQSGPVTVTLSASDGSGSGLASTQYCVDAVNACAPSTSGNSVALSCAAGGTCQYYVRYRSQDAVGNQEAVKSASVQIDGGPAPDTQAPAAGALSANPDASGYVRSPFNLSAPFTDNVGVTACEKTSDGSSWSAATLNASSGPIACSASGLTCSDGQALTLNLRARDAAGNWGEGTALSRTCDDAAPATTDNAPAAWQGADVTVALSAVDGGVGVSWTAYCVDTADACSPGASGTSVAVTCAAGGLCQKYVRYASQDILNHWEAVKSALVRIDKQAPSGGSISYPNGNTASPVSVNFVNGSDGGGVGLGTRIIQRAEAGMQGNSCQAFGGWADAFTNAASSPVSDSVATKKCYKYRYIVRDLLGNEAIYTSPNIAKVK